MQDAGLDHGAPSIIDRAGETDPARALARIARSVGAVRFEDPLTIEVTVEKLGQKSVTYNFAFQCEGRQVATGTMTAVCCRLNPDGTLASIPIPADIRARLAGERM